MNPFKKQILMAMTAMLSVGGLGAVAAVSINENIASSQINAVDTQKFALVFQDNGTIGDSTTVLTTSTAVSDILSDSGDTDAVSAISAVAYAYKGKTGYGLKFGTSKAKGTITLAIADDYQCVPSKIEITACHYGSDAKNMVVVIGSNSYSVTLTDSKETLTKYEIDTSKETGKLTSITIQASAASSARFYMTDLTVFEDKAAPSETHSVQLNCPTLLESGETTKATASCGYPNCTITGFTSSNTDVATVDASGDITAKAAGTTKITATCSGGETDEVDLTVWTQPAKQKVTIAEAIAASASPCVLYEIEGTITAWASGKTDATKYGNFYLADSSVSDNGLYIFGASMTSSAMSHTYNDGTVTYKFANPQDFLTNEVTKTAVIGSTVKMYGYRLDYTNTTTGITTIEFCGVITSLESEETITGLSVGSATAKIGGTLSSSDLLVKTVTNTGAETVTSDYSVEVGRQYNSTFSKRADLVFGTTTMKASDNALRITYTKDASISTIADLTIANDDSSSVNTIDTITKDDLSATDTAYTPSNGVGSNTARYSAFTNIPSSTDGGISLRGTQTKNSVTSCSGISTTTSGGIAKSATVTVSSQSTSGRTLVFYGQHTAYGEAVGTNGLQGVATVSDRGEEIARFSYNGTDMTYTVQLNDNDAFEYICVYPVGGLIIIDSLSITWGTVSKAISEEAKIMDFVNECLHPEIPSTESGTGLCVSSNWYETAKSALIGPEYGTYGYYYGLMKSFRNSTDEDIVAYRNRYEAWAIANNDATPYSISSSSLNKVVDILSVDEDTVIAVTVLCGVGALLTGFFLIRKKKHA